MYKYVPLLKSLSAYTFAGVYEKAVGFLLLPIILSYVSTEDMGLYSLIFVVWNIVGCFVTLQLKGPMGVQFFKLDSDGLKRYFASSISLTWLGLGFTYLLMLLCSWYLVGVLNIPLLWVFLLPLMGLLTQLPGIYQVLMQSAKKAKEYVVFTMGQTTMRLLVSLLLVSVFGLGYHGMLWGLLLSGLAFSIYSTYYFSKNDYFKPEKDKEYRKDALMMGLSLIPHFLGAYIIEASDRFFLAGMVTKSELGVYSVAYTIGNLINFFQFAITQVWSPHAYKLLQENSEKSRRKYVISCYLMWGLIIAGVFGLWVLTPVIFWFCPPQYAPGMAYIPYIALGAAFLGFYKSAGTIIYFHQKNAYFVWVSVVNVIVTLTLNYFCIKYYGVIGAAYATLIAYMVFFVIVFVLAQRIHPMPWLSFYKRRLETGD